ncbi:unnamed protein product [Lactuca virosa]|uniref:non-specific serine/threonine protein kinase n=1 Tax=Lactuca virosa TaxID=75947 RepID=A0AAU9NBE9_9ASTR|nr:unnamed protein product [Lactuca virosa]
MDTISFAIQFCFLQKPDHLAGLSTGLCRSHHQPHISVTTTHSLTIAGIKFAGMHSLMQSVNKVKSLATFQHDEKCKVGAYFWLDTCMFVGNSDLCGKQINKLCKDEVGNQQPTGNQNVKKNSGRLLMSASATVGALLLVALMCFWGASIVMFHGDLPYSSKDIIKKLEALNDEHIIGAGGFGTVYKLSMDDGNVFALKRIDTSKLLLYDYLAGASLDEALHENGDEQLAWEKRVKIIMGAAKGLAYLHHDCSPRIIHRDIKSSNILLDGNFKARVSDFGLAKLLEDEESHITTIVAGTFGYLAPEYMQSGRATEKTDVYSFGVLMLEVGGTPVMEQMIVAGKVVPILQLEHGVVVVRVYIGSFMTFLDMAEQAILQRLDVATKALHWPIGVDGWWI